MPTRSLLLILLSSLSLGLMYWANTDGATAQHKNITQNWYYPDPPGAPLEQIEILRSYPHNPQAFTQGLEISGQRVLESTGLHGQSALFEWELASGKVLKKQSLAPQYFGEGMTRFKDKIYQLTWRSGLGFVYSAEDFKRQSQFRYTGEGWGLSHNGKALILSDGSASLRFLDPQSLKVIRKLKVFVPQGEVARLNELEWIPAQGKQAASLLANIWETPYIARIDPQSGRVKSWIDLRPLWDGPESERLRGAVPNGIAYDRASGELFVTGKLWPKLYVIRLIKPKN